MANNLDPVQSEINTLHNQTIDRVTGYQNQYQPTVTHYDKMRVTLPCCTLPSLASGTLALSGLLDLCSCHGQHDSDLA